MSRWPPTSDPAAELIASLDHQPLLVVLRPSSPLEAAASLASFAALGLRHIEIAWRSGDRWIRECQQLIEAFPTLRLGAASIHSSEALDAVLAAGFRYAVSPVLDATLLERAGSDLVLIPGVMTPTEVWRARGLGCRLVKLFPAASVGPAHWRRLVAPLGPDLPFCIAAGGLGPADVIPWLEAGVDAIALGSSLSSEPPASLSDPSGHREPFGALRDLLARLSS